MNSRLLKVEDSSHAAETRRAARDLAAMLGFDESSMERAAIAASEASTNLLKHAGGGQMFVSSADYGKTPVVELLALDSGPGMHDAATCARDGFSTSGTLGQGLGAIERMSVFYDLYSQSGRGTALLARISTDRRFQAGEVRVSGLDAPKPGETVCGDSWNVWESDGHMLIVLADGLGHGPDAARASRTAIEIAEDHRSRKPVEIIDLINRGIRHTRGAAVGVAALDRERGVVTFATLGNIYGRICELDKPSRQMVSMNGTAGGDTRAIIKEFQYPWPAGSVVVVHSDGLATRWELDSYGGLLSRDPALIAGVLFRDYRRLSDDSSVVVAK